MRALIAGHIQNFGRQILLSDQNGCYPGDSHCLPPYSDQPVLTRTH